jgi:nuclear pore complex protein Nup205
VHSRVTTRFTLLHHYLIIVFPEPEISLVLSPVTTTPRYEERGFLGARYLQSISIAAADVLLSVTATAPSIGDTIEALNNLCTDLATSLKKMVDISAELASRDNIRVDNDREVNHLRCAAS